MARYTLVERVERLRMPLVFATILTLVAAARFDGLRPIEAECVALGIPLYTAFSGAGPFHEANLALRRSVFFVAGALVLSAEVGIYGVLFGDGAPFSLLTARLLFAGSGLLAIVLQGVAAQRGFRTRLGAWLCFGAVFSSYFLEHVTQKNLFGSTLGALLIGLLLGGGTGLLLGELSVKLLRGR
jgi:hypothetical protein